MTSGQVGKIVKSIQKSTTVVLTYDESTPDQKQLEENYIAIGNEIRAQTFKVSDEHVGQVAKSLAVKTKKALSWLNPEAPTEVKEVEKAEKAEKIAHLEDFPSDADKKLKSHDPQSVSVLARVDGGRIAEAENDSKIKSALESPDTSTEVTSTTSDGEVKPLINTLSDFVAYLGQKSNQALKHHFTIALVGPYGPCNGCKKRITKFIELWSKSAIALMKTGVTAKLTLTCKYSKEPQEHHGQVYGYTEDATQRSPFLHTVVTEVTGTNSAS